jgi:hypothetical protein
MTYFKNDNPLVDRRIILSSTDPRAHELWDRFWQEEVPDHEKAAYFPENSVVKNGDSVLYTRTVRGIVNLLSMDGNALNERILKLRNLEIDQIIKVTITVLDDDAIVSGEN